ncbi:unnamed protein product [Vitrella brassicaformis CCMP3155]|uniref:Uncharacterized protein n=1 Tax=Vitrella brassicaformis (strain CCMP3155) TaxID=1169540 RepID=A0A0G4EPP0_VITBC|nr:unnamed protein product [Vitrella brassicaformis CCMP3155]|eukprot:CEL99405.1 unnamed protein product [Vitrella brassicaformis CCMP3155]
MKRLTLPDLQERVGGLSYVSIGGTRGVSSSISAAAAVGLKNDFTEDAGIAVTSLRSCSLHLGTQTGPTAAGGGQEDRDRGTDRASTFRTRWQQQQPPVAAMESVRRSRISVRIFVIM